jgi:group I intron endonuclease
MGVIYLARNKVNGKGYVGATSRSLPSRIDEEKSLARRGGLQALCCAIREYGEDAFEWIILREDEDNDKEWLEWWEGKFIRALGTKVPNGYNMTDFGVRGYKHTKEAIEIIRQSKIGRSPSEETRAKLRARRNGLGKHRSYEQRVEMSNRTRLSWENRRLKYGPFGHS